MSDDKVSGIVKWFSDEKGYGYITNNENEDLYFGIKDIYGADLPENGDKVQFNEYIGKENTKAATNIDIIYRKNPSLKQVHCDKCDRHVEPKPWYYGGSDYTVVNVDLLCPFCGNRIIKTGGGFSNLGANIVFFGLLALMFSLYHFFR